MAIIKNMMDTVFFILTHFCLFAQRSSQYKKTRGDFDMNSIVLLILGVGVVAILSVIAYYVGSHLRKGAVEKDKPPSMSDHLKTFQEAAEEGNMTTKEYAIVKKYLAQKIMDEVKSESRLQASDFLLLEEVSNDTP